MDAVTRLRHGRSQTKQTVGLWIGLVTVHTFTSSVTLKPECVPCGGAGLQAQFSGGLLHEPEWFEPSTKSDSRRHRIHRFCRGASTGGDGRVGPDA